MKMYTRRKLVVGMAGTAALLGGASLLSGCDSIQQIISRSIARNDDQSVDELGDSADDRVLDTREGGTLHVASRWPAAIEPLHLQDMYGIQVASCLFDPLVRYDYRTGRLVGAAATSWEANEEGTVFTFTLVDGGRFHNGDAVTAANFKYSWERLLRPDSSGVSSENAPYLSMIKGAAELMAGEADEATGIRAIDQLTLEVTLNAPFYDFPQMLVYPAFAPVPSWGIAEDVDAFEIKPIGNGPFEVQGYGSWEGNTLRIARFDRYHGELPLLSAIKFTFFEDDRVGDGGPSGEGEVWTTAHRPLRRAGNSQALRQAVDRLRLHATLEHAGQAAAPVQPPHQIIVPGLHRAADSQFMTHEMKAYEGFNHGEIDLSPVPVEDFEDALFSYGEAPDGCTATPGSQVLSGPEVYTQLLWLNFWHEPLTDARVRQALSYAINREALCREVYLDTCSPASGIIPPDFAGFRDGAWPAATYDVSRAKQLLADAGYPEGEGLAPITLAVSGTESDRKLFEMIEADLKAAGFTVETSVASESERFWDTLENSASLTLTGWIADFPLMESFLTSLFAGFGSYNQFGYDNPAVNEGIVAARAIADEKERLAAFQAVDDLIAADMPVVPLFFMRHTLVCSDRVNDLYVAPDILADFPKAWVSV
jgi:ABC-type transport system substrate-binding protein